MAMPKPTILTGEDKRMDAEMRIPDNGGDMKPEKPNNIDWIVTTADKTRKKPAAEYGRQILQLLAEAVPYSTMFIESIPLAARHFAEIELKAKFEQWANSWIAPICREMIANSQDFTPRF